MINPRIPNQRSKSHLNCFKEPGLTFVIIRASSSREKEKEGGICDVSTNLGLVLRKASVYIATLSKRVCLNFAMNFENCDEVDKVS